MLSKEAFSFTYEVEAMSKEGMEVIGRCGCVGKVDSRTEWVWGRGVMDSVCETDDGGADDGTYDGSANGNANNECANVHRFEVTGLIKLERIVVGPNSVLGEGERRVRSWLRSVPLFRQ